MTRQNLGFYDVPSDFEALSEAEQMTWARSVAAQMQARFAEQAAGTASPSSPTPVETGTGELAASTTKTGRGRRTT